MPEWDSTNRGDVKHLVTRQLPQPSDRHRVARSSLGGATLTNLLPLAGGAIALAGVDKLAGDRPYVEMFRHLGWSEDGMQAAAVTEVAGGLLMVPRSTRRLGGAMVAAVSAMVMLSESSKGEMRLAAPRGMVLLAGLAALLAPGE